MRLRIVVTAAVAITGLSSIARANETYKFDQAHSTIGFSVHQFLGTTHGKFTKFDGKIDIDREHPGNSSVAARIDDAALEHGLVTLSTQPTGDGYAGDQSLFAPAFTATDEELAEMVARFSAVVHDIADQVERELAGREPVPVAAPSGDKQ